MADSFYRAGEPIFVDSTRNSVTDDAALLRPKPALDIDALPSIDRIKKNRSETFGVIFLLATFYVTTSHW